MPRTTLTSPSSVLSSRTPQPERGFDESRLIRLSEAVDVSVANPLQHRFVMKWITQGRGRRRRENPRRAMKGGMFCWIWMKHDIVMFNRDHAEGIETGGGF